MMGAATENARLPRFSFVLEIESCCDVDDLSSLGMSIPTESLCGNINYNWLSFTLFRISSLLPWSFKLIRLIHYKTVWVISSSSALTITGVDGNGFSMSTILSCPFNFHNIASPSSTRYDPLYVFLQSFLQYCLL